MTVSQSNVRKVISEEGKFLLCQSGKVNFIKKTYPEGSEFAILGRRKLNSIFLA